MPHEQRVSVAAALRAILDQLVIYPAHGSDPVNVDTHKLAADLAARGVAPPARLGGAEQRTGG